MKNEYKPYKPTKDVKFYRGDEMCSGKDTSCEGMCIYIKEYDVFICGKDLEEKLVRR